MEESKDASQDFYKMETGLLNLKVISGLAQMAFAVLMYFANKYYFQFDIFEYGAYATFGVGFFLVGVKSNTLISPSRKLIKIMKGFLFFTFSHRYSASEISKVTVTKSTTYGDDSNGIGPTRENVLITTYTVEIVLKNTTVKSITSGRELTEMNAFASRVGMALDVPVIAL